jgi:hypothetical protein
MAVQIEFTHFPGYEPVAVMDGWRHLPTPWRRLADAEVSDLANLDPDPLMELVDWAIDDHPQVFDVDWTDGDYEPANDLSVDLAGQLFYLAENVLDGNGCAPGKGGVWSERYKDVQLADGVVVRAAYFTT